MKYTDNELKIIGLFNRFMNYDTLEANLEDNCTCLDVKVLAELSGLTVKSVKGVVGSLTKKNLVFVDEFNMGQTVLMVTDKGIREYFRLNEEKENDEMVTVVRKDTGVEYKAKAIEGGYELFTLEGEKYKKLKESTFKRYFKLVEEKATEPVTDSDWDEPETKAEEPKKTAPEPHVELDGEGRENMIEKIKKILKLSKNNPSQEEGMSAALQAQKLMKKYSIHEDEVSLEEINPEEISESTVKFKHNSHLFAWYKNLSITVAKNFRVKAYLDGKKDVVFRGFTEDTKIAAEVYKYLYALGDKLACQACTKAHEETGNVKGVYNSFIIGYLEGIESALGEQCTALMLVVPKAVEEDYEVFSASLEQKKTRVNGKKDKNYDAGLVEGKAAVKSRQLTEKKGGKN